MPSNYDFYKMRDGSGKEKIIIKLELNEQGKIPVGLIHNVMEQFVKLAAEPIQFARFEKGL